MQFTRISIHSVSFTICSFLMFNVHSTRSIFHAFHTDHRQSEHKQIRSLQLLSPAPSFFHIPTSKISQSLCLTSQLVANYTSLPQLNKERRQNEDQAADIGVCNSGKFSVLISWHFFIHRRSAIHRLQCGRQMG